MYSRTCQYQLIHANICKYLANLSLTRTYVTKTQDEFKILQVSERRKKERDYLPGIENRKELLQEWNSSPYENENEIISPEIDPEEFNSMQADFMNMDRSFDEYEREKLMKRKIKIQKQVRKKHFPEAKYPKLLTITEMFQIKLLHKKNPIEWNIEKLAESFPATPEVIMKVINNNVFRSPERMLQHDLEVKQNWLLQRQGSLVGLSPAYECHLLAFSHRDPIVRTIAEYKKFVPPPFRYVPESTEFRSIITSYYDSINKNKQTSTYSDQYIRESTTPLLEEGIISGAITENELSYKGNIHSNAEINTRPISANTWNQTSSSYSCPPNRNEISRNSGNVFTKSTNRKRFEPKSNGRFARWFSSGSIINETTLNEKNMEQTSDEGKESHTAFKKENEAEGNVDLERTASEKNNCDIQIASSESGDFSNEIPLSVHSRVNQRTESVGHSKETQRPQSANENNPSVDLNRTMHASKPAYWRHIEREREERQKEKERVKMELATDSTKHDGKWRRIKPNIGENNFTPLDGELRHQYSYDDDNRNDYRHDNYGRRLDRTRIDLDRINRQRVPSSIMIDEDEELLPEEKYERYLERSGTNVRNPRFNDSYGDVIESERDNFNHQRDNFNEQRGSFTNQKKILNGRDVSNYGAGEEFLDETQLSEDARSNSSMSVNTCQSTEEEQETGSSEESSRKESGGPLSEGILLNPPSSDKSKGSTDINRKMYPKKPPHWEEIVRQRRREEVEKMAVKKMIEEDMSDRSMYDGMWRRLRPREQGDNPFALEDNRPHVGPLTTRRMDTLTNSEDEDHLNHVQKSDAQSNFNSALASHSGEPDRDRPKFDYYLEEGIDTQRSASHYTLDNLRQKLDKKQIQGTSSLDRDEVALLSSFEKKKRMDANEAVHTNDIVQDIGVDTHELVLSNNASVSTSDIESGVTESVEPQITSYNTRASQSDPLFSGMVNYTGIVSQGVDVTERDVEVERANYVELKIRIPKDLYKENAIYKLEDCFYDDQGEFLYRVPGLKNA